MQLKLNKTHELTELILNGLTTAQSNRKDRFNQSMTVKSRKATHLEVTFRAK